VFEDNKTNNKGKPGNNLPPRDFSGSHKVRLKHSHQRRRTQRAQSEHEEIVPDNEEQACTSVALQSDLPKQTINEILPPEVILKIFEFLELEGLGSVMEVCKWWYQISDTPRLWSNTNKYIIINRSNVALIPRALNMWRLSKVKEIIVDTISPEAIEAVNNHDMITDVSVNNMLCTVTGQTLATMVKRKEVVNIGATHLNMDQLPEIFEAIAESKTLISLGIGFNDLSLVGAKPFAAAISRLVNVSLFHTRLTANQLGCLMKAISEDTELECLDISGNRIQSVEPKYLENAVKKLKGLNISHTRLTPHQVEAIFTGLNGKTKMVNLTINYNDLSSLNATKLAMAITKLTTASIGTTKLTPHQVTTLMIAITEKQNKLKHLNIGQTDLSKIEPRI
jgi:hypothetical protein